MECPICGMENPQTSSHCNCGYDFHAGIDHLREPPVKGAATIPGLGTTLHPDRGQSLPGHTAGTRRNFTNVLLKVLFPLISILVLIVDSVMRETGSGIEASLHDPKEAQDSIAVFTSEEALDSYLSCPGSEDRVEN